MLQGGHSTTKQFTAAVVQSLGRQLPVSSMAGEGGKSFTFARMMHSNHQK